MCGEFRALAAEPGPMVEKAMYPLRFPVAVVIECVPLANRWASEEWRVATVERVRSAAHDLANGGFVGRGALVSPTDGRADDERGRRRTTGHRPR